MTERSVSSSDSSATPRPTTGIVLSSLRVMVGIPDNSLGDDSVGVISASCEFEGAGVWSQPGAVVERGDRCHIIVAQLEVEHVEVARYPLGIHRLGDDDVTDLQ